MVPLLLTCSGTGAAAFHHRPPHRLAGVLLRDPAWSGARRDRRPVRGHQLGDRRDHAVQVPGPGRHLDQRQLLGGAILGSFAALVFLNAFAVNVGWRLAFLMGPVLALVVAVVARTLPESPRWLLTHDRSRRPRELAKIEEVARRSGQELAEVDEDAAITLVPEQKYGAPDVPAAGVPPVPQARHPGRDHNDHPVVLSTTPSSSPTPWCSRPSMG